MRVGVVTTQAPFIIGGAERHSANLVTALKARGHEATEISIPYKWYPARALVDHVLAAKLIDLTDLGYPVDLAVGLKFPAYLVRHPNKVFWILHQHRQAYDLWEAGISELQHDPDGAGVRELIRAEDRAAIGASGARVYANSRNVTDRLQRYLGLGSQPLYHPPPNAERLRPGPFGDYLFAPSRLGPNKRQALMIESLAHAPGVRLKLAGPPDAPGYDDELRQLARARGVEERCEILGPISDAEMLRHYSECRGVVFVPIDEDYGYITLEAMLSGKPVVTATDSGGPLEFIRDGAEGVVVAPEPAALGAAYLRLMDGAAEAERMGEAARATYRAKGIGWDRVVEVLTGEPLPHPAESAPVDPAGAAVPPAQLDLSEIKDRLAPPQPLQMPFADLGALLAAYDFGTHPGDWDAQEPLHRPYFETHWRRYCATLALLEPLVPERILDIGIVPPFLFQGLLAARFPEAQLSGVWSDPRPFAQTLQARGAPGRDFAVALSPCNVERDRLPYADGSVDLVLGMEILEHLAVDPLWFLAEINRVLAPGGHLLLSTPNMTSHRSVTKVLGGAAPYSFGPFVPVGGAYGRHNREYAPAELRALAEAAGFETGRLLSADVYDDRIEPATAALLTARGDHMALRGETLFWLGHKTTAPGAAPEGLYHGQPDQHAGRLTLEHRSAEGVTVRATNLARADWATEGPFAITLCLDWQDARGRLVHHGAQYPLPTGVPVGASITVPLALGELGGGASRGTVTIGLFEAGAGRLSGTGRSNTLRLACSEAAFLGLVRP
ncbi:MAG: glycosyltransferase [Pseudomonadota bacterium]